MGKILLEGMEFYAYHGVYEEEREKGQLFSIDLELRAEFSKACFSDQLDDAIDYVGIYDLVKKEMEIASSLIEHVANRIIERIRKNIPDVEEIKVKITKLHPPIEAKLKGISIELVYSNPTIH